MTAKHRCEEYLEERLGSATPAGVEPCAECRDLADELSRDQVRLREHFGRLPVPPMPAIPFRKPLSAASGHPRRVSTNVIPMLWLVSLAVLLLVAFLMMWLVVQLASAQLPPEDPTGADPRLAAVERSSRQDRVEARTMDTPTEEITPARAASPRDRGRRP